MCPPPTFLHYPPYEHSCRYAPTVFLSPPVRTPSVYIICLVQVSYTCKTIQLRLHTALRVCSNVAQHKAVFWELLKQLLNFICSSFFHQKKFWFLSAENFAVLGCQATLIGSYLPTFLDKPIVFHLQGSGSVWTSPHSGMILTTIIFLSVLWRGMNRPIYKWVVWKVLNLDHRWQQYRQDLFPELVHLS